MRYWKFEICPDKYSWQLNIYWTVKDLTSDNYWKENIIYSCWPSTLENGLLKIRTYLIKELVDSTEILEVDKLIEWIRTLDKEFKDFIWLNK